jgi:isoquinoline 1-oxidoreductase beta subunit
MTTPSLSRRLFVTGSLMAGGGLLFELSVPHIAQAADGASTVPLTAFIRVLQGNRFVIGGKNAEIGQGANTTLAMMIAEEFDVDWDQVMVEQTHADQSLFGAQSAGGSRTTAREWVPMRQAGAAARHMLVAAAAQTWNVPVDSLSTASGTVRHGLSGRSITYAELAPSALAIASPEPATLKLKQPDQYRIIGKPIRGVDTPAIVAGKPLFGIDARQPGMLYAVLETCPTPGGRFKSANLDAVRKLPGVRHVLTIAGDGQAESLVDGVAILSTSFWTAKTAREKLEVVWDDTELRRFSTESYAAQAAQALKGPGAEELLRKGESEAVFAGAAKTVEARYDYPFLAHGALEPQNCTALFREGALEIWAPTQNPESGRGLVAKALGIAPQNIRINLTRVGGGFGRRLMNDYMVQAAAIAVKVPGTPVKLLYTREDDFRRDFFRPGGWHAFSAALDSNGRLVGFRDHFVSFGQGRSPVRAGELPGAMVPANLVDAVLLEQTLLATNLPTGWLRAPGSNALGFVSQAFLDEVAQAAGKDLPTLMLDLLGEPRPLRAEGRGPAFHTGRARSVIDKVVAMADWAGRKTLGQGRGKGFAFYFSHAGYFAEVVEASVADGEVTVHEVWAAGDVGSQIVNPLNAMHQVQGSVIEGLGQALAGQKITQVDGAIEQANFDAHPFQRIEATPKINVEFVLSDNPPTGLGEPALPPVIPALVNAIHAATGTRVRSLPVDFAQKA